MPLSARDNNGIFIRISFLQAGAVLVPFDQSPHPSVQLPAGILGDFSSNPEDSGSFDNSHSIWPASHAGGIGCLGQRDKKPALCLVFPGRHDQLHLLHQKGRERPEILSFFLPFVHPFAFIKVNSGYASAGILYPGLFSS